MGKTFKDRDSIGRRKPKRRKENSESKNKNGFRSDNDLNKSIDIYDSTNSYQIKSNNY